MSEKLKGRLSCGQRLSCRLSSVLKSITARLITKQVTANGSYSASADSADGYSAVEVAVPIPPEPVLITKQVTANGSYSASSDSADGYSAVEVAVPILRQNPIQSDLDSGYVNHTVSGDTTNWVYQAASNNRSDVYRVKANTRYLFSLSGVVGTRFRILFSETSPVGTTTNISGVYVNKLFNQGYNLNGSPQPYAVGYYTTPGDGYITIQKDNAGTNGIVVYMFEIP